MSETQRYNRTLPTLRACTHKARPTPSSPARHYSTTQFAPPLSSAPDDAVELHCGLVCAAAGVADSAPGAGCPCTRNPSHIDREPCAPAAWPSPAVGPLNPQASPPPLAPLFICPACLPCSFVRTTFDTYTLSPNALPAPWLRLAIGLFAGRALCSAEPKRSTYISWPVIFQIPPADVQVESDAVT